MIPLYKPTDKKKSYKKIRDPSKIYNTEIITNGKSIQKKKINTVRER